jgi:hypothetical protein
MTSLKKKHLKKQTNSLYLYIQINKELPRPSHIHDDGWKKLKTQLHYIKNRPRKGLDSFLPQNQMGRRY